jgi:hypothetical protein
MIFFASAGGILRTLIHSKSTYQKIAANILKLPPHAVNSDATN